MSRIASCGIKARQVGADDASSSSPSGTPAEGKGQLACHGALETALFAHPEGERVCILHEVIRPRSGSLGAQRAFSRITAPCFEDAFYALVMTTCVHAHVRACARAV